MEFNSDGICVLSSITHPDECDAYIEFLQDERERHLSALTDAVWCSSINKPALAKFYDSAVTRHQQDIDGIDRRIVEIQAHKAKLEGK